MEGLSKSQIYYRRNINKIRQYYQDNKEKIKKYTAQTKEKRRAYFRKWYYENRCKCMGKITERNKKYSDEKKEKKEIKKKEIEMDIDIKLIPEFNMSFN